MENGNVPLKKAVKMVMRRRHVSRREAEAMVKEAIAKGDLGAHWADPFTGKPIPYRTQHYLTETQGQQNTISGERAVEWSTAAPKDVGLPLSELINKLGFTQDELLGEMRAGRLIPSGEMFVTGDPNNVRVGARNVVISMAQLDQWFARDDVPEEFKWRIINNLRRL